MKQEILSLLNKLQSVSLATCEGDSPRVRPMTLIVKDEHFFFATGAGDNKTLQLNTNPHAEFLLFIPSEGNTGYLRGSGIMQRVMDSALKRDIADWAPFIYNYFTDPDDPGFALFELQIQQLGYMKPGEMYETLCKW